MIKIKHEQENKLMVKTEVSYKRETFFMKIVESLTN